MGCFLAMLVGLAIGTLEATTWVFGLIPAVRAIIPYAAALAMLIFAITPLLAVCFKNKMTPVPGESDYHRVRFLLCYVITIMIAAAVFLIFVQIFLGAALAFVLKVILAYVGSISFWIMLVAFLLYVFYLVRPRR